MTYSASRSSGAGEITRPLRFVGVLLLTLIGVLPAPAQTPALNPSAARDSADVLAERAGEAYHADTHESLQDAIGWYAEAASLYRLAGEPAEAADLLANAALIHNGLGRPDSALVYYERALGLARGAEDGVAESVVLLRLGELRHGRGELDAALARYREALAGLEGAGVREDVGVALSNIGIALHDLGRPDSALHYLHRALEIRRETGDRRGESVTLNNLARVHQTLGRPDSAVVYLREALDAKREVGDRAGEGTVINNLGYAFELLGEPDSALVHYREALPILRETGRRSTEGITLANIGRAYLDLNRPDSALVYLREGLAVKREVDDRAGESWALDDLGRAYQALGRPQVARSHYDSALVALREVGDRAREGLTLYHHAQLRRARSDLAAAVAYYDSAAAARSGVGARAGGEANRVSFTEQDVPLFEEWALSWLGRGTEVGAERAALAALAVSERGRAQALLDMMRGEPVAQTAGADLSAEGARRVAEISRSGAWTLSYQATRDTLLAFLISPQGELRVGRRAISRDSLAELVAGWRLGMGAGADLAPDRESEATRWVPQLELKAAPGERGIGIKLAKACPERARGLCVRQRAPPTEAQWRELGRALDALLLPEEMEGVFPRSGELVIVPHGPLTLLPFAAFALGGGDPAGTRFAIRYTPSLATLAEAEARPSVSREIAGGAALVVGDPAMPLVQTAGGPEVRLPPLPASGREGRWVADVLGTSALSGEEASEARVRARLPDARLVHLATHGFAFSSDARARASFVALAPGSDEDGLLTVGEVLDRVPRIPADLVVLSACQTGLGNLKQAEGTLGLQRAFLAKGARSVLVSLWSVSDEATEALMKAFYGHWLNDADRPGKAESLRRAQRNVRQRPEFRDPRYWAAFQLVGAG